MIRDFQMADWFTLANAACGTGAIFAMLDYLAGQKVVEIYQAVFLVCLALCFDFLDGRIARWRRQASPLGQELDSLADVISFGVAPAMIAHGCGMDGALDRMVLVYFVCCGVSRLARFNVTASSLADASGKVSHFEGTPIPTAAILVLLMAVAASRGATGDALWLGEIELANLTFHPLVLLYGLLGTLMISRIPIPKI